MNAANPLDLATPAIASKPRRLRFFYFALVAAVIVFVGFAPTFYLRETFHGPALPALLVAHGTVFSAWIVLLVAQMLLVRNARIAVTRRRVHPVFAIVGPLTLLSFPLRVAFSHTEAWHRAAEWMTSLAR